MVTAPMRHGVEKASPPRRVVVVGAHGFVGGAVTRRLIAAGSDVLVLTRHDVDLCASDAGARLAAHLRPEDAVVLAAAIAPCKSSAMLAENLAMVRAMIEALRVSPPAHIVNISSDAVYPDSMRPLSEVTPPAPDSLHGVMHLARELSLSSEVEAPMAHVRPTLIYGLGDPHNGYGPNRFLREAARGDTITLFGAGEELRDHVWVEDVAEIVLRVLMHTSTGALNIATGEVHSFHQVAEWAVAGGDAASRIAQTQRQGPMPHNGYRAFDPELTFRLFPGFNYRPLRKGLAHVQAEMAALRLSDGADG